MDSLFSPINSGSTIGVVALGSPLSPEREALGLAELKRLGYQVSMPLACSKYYGDYAHGFANGSITERVSAFRQLVQDPEVKAILSARGGYGVIELMSELDAPWFKNSDTPLIGLSDITILLGQGTNGFRSPMIHGPSLGDAFADASTDQAARASVDSLIELFQARPYEYQAQLSELRKGKEVSGRLLAGNLSMFCALLGTPWEVSFDGAVVVLEEVGEAPYKIHRNLLQLTLAGKFANVAAVVFGRFSKCEATNGPQVEAVWSLVLQSIWKEYSFPVACGLPLGHWGENHALPIGARALVSDSTFCVSGSGVAGSLDGS